jgi:hypothetical protein
MDIIIINIIINIIIIIIIITLCPNLVAYILNNQTNSLC